MLKGAFPLKVSSANQAMCTEVCYMPKNIKMLYY